MTSIFSIDVVLTPLHDLVAPPLTSKLLKYCLEGKLPRKRFESFGNVTYTQLCEGGRPLYSVGESPLVLKSGSQYSGRVTVVTDTHEFISDIGTGIKCAGSYGEYYLSFSKIEMLDLRYIAMDLGRIFKVVFETPTLLTAKLMTPPSLKNKVHGLPELHKLIPQASFIFSYLLKLWNSYAPPEAKIPKPPYNEWAPYKLGRLADITLTEIDYRVRPETVIIGRNNKGVLRKTRGFIGWVIYASIAPKELHSTYAKLLALAELVGIGRSRGIGLGQIKVININTKNTETKNSTYWWEFPRRPRESRKRYIKDDL